MKNRRNTMTTTNGMVGSAPVNGSPNGPLWWKEGVIYQVYPASFKDSNGDGMGDIPGIISKLDHLKSLGVDIVWVSPMYESPQVDMGYDISNYEAIYAPFGTVDDAQGLIDGCHARGMRIIFDLVVNHTSDQHAWFKESRSSKDNPKSDWYIWRPARYTPDGKRKPPNNWASIFSGSAWKWEETRQEYYLHLFTVEQPDLNWENPVTRQAIYKSAMETWLKKGVDGFRIDMVNVYSKGTSFPDAPIVDPETFEQNAWHMYTNGPRMHEFLREMNSEVLSKYNAMTVGEAQFTSDSQQVLSYIKASDRQLDMVFLFDAMDLGQGKTYKYGGDGEWSMSDFKTILTKWQSFIDGTDGWTTAFLENHDNGRSVSRFASDAPEWRERSAKMLALMTASMTGTLFLYQGQEIGMTNMPKDWPIEDYQDVEALNFYKMMKERDPTLLPGIMKTIQSIGRDHARLPMQWDTTPFAGFTTSPKGAWMRTHDAYKTINVASQEANPTSVLRFWRSMLKLRKEYKDLFVYGSFHAWDLKDSKTFVFGKRRANGRECAIVAVNFTADDVEWRRPDFGTGMRWWLLAENVDEEVEGKGEEDVLRPFEGRIYIVS